MSTGIVFDIRDFALHDGPGIRTTVFMKGCPLRCSWCHNPEGLSPEPQTIRGDAGERIVGRTYADGELAAILNAQSEVLNMNAGGVTFSGGEPLMQAGFVADVINRLDGIHIVMDTSGYGDQDAFHLLVAASDLVLFDLKIMDPDTHLRYTACSNQPILRNLDLLAEMDVPYVIRVPLVPGVTDTDENLAAIAQYLAGMPDLLRVELLPYNRAAGGKYASCGMVFCPDYDEAGVLNLNLTPFVERGVEAIIA
jgi:pyruvate formate lyase activating enzyme